MLLTFFLLINISLKSQEKELFISYDYKINGQVLISAERSAVADLGMHLFATKKQVITRRLNGISPKYDNNSNMISKDSIYDYVVKEYNKNQLITTIEVGRDFVLLKEALDLFSWELCEETKTILGYSCNKATCTFRGRNYIAYFTREIPFKAAPWKFHGLPGVVLEVYSADYFVSWTAQSLEIRPYERKFELPFSGVETINWHQFTRFIKNLQQKRIEAYRNYHMANGSNFIIDSDVKKEILNTIEVFNFE